VKKVLVIGGGIGGLSTALALRKGGIGVDLVEINQQWTVYHVGIVVQGNALRAMAALGVAEKCVAVGFPYDGLEFRDLQGNLLADIHGAKVAGPHLPADLGLTRPALHKVLTDAVREAGVNVRLGLTFREIDAYGDRVTVTFTDGTRGDYDLVVGADGAYSKVRGVLFGDTYKPAFTGQGVWRYNVPRPPELTRAVMFAGLDTGKCGFIPLTPDTGYVLLVQAESATERIPQEKLAESFRARLARCTGIMARLREQITDSSLVVYRPLQALFVEEPWYKGRVVLLGDAVHAITPHLGQGAAQAMEDGVVLGELCSQNLPVEEVLARFARRRYDRCKLIYEGSLQIGAWEQHPSPEADPAGLTARMVGLFAQEI
jgi:2-polyprenyl-6-methoxyphenol hydroxylase-like FAD-dependent oxidoreductase